MIKDILVLLAGLLSLVYLMNPTAGVFELIPDNLPIVGNLDEAATAGTYKYSGVNYNRIQLLTIKDIIEDKKHFHSPSVVGIKEATGQLNLPI